MVGVITSHLGPLKAGWKSDSGIISGSLEYNKATGLPSYKLIPGAPGQSLALQTAQRIGIDPTILERAFAHLRPEVKAAHQRLNEIDSIKTELVELSDRLREERNQTNSLKMQYEKKLRDFDIEKQTVLEKIARDTRQEIDAAIAKSEVENAFKRHENLAKIRQDLPQIIKHTTGIAPLNAAPNEPTVDTAEEFAKAFPAGTRVYVTSIGKEGIIQGEPNAKGDVPILSQSMRLMVPWKDLRNSRPSGNTTAKILRQNGIFNVGLTMDERIVDLRGFTVDDDITELERQLDSAVLNQEDRVKVIHGHGTETLKRSLRAHLSRHNHVTSWKAGNKETGGDGITWVELK